MRTVCGLLAMLALAVVVGCGSGQGGGGAKKPRVAVVPKSTNHEFWKVVGQGAQDAAGKDAEIIFKSGEPQDDAQAQIALVERMFGQADAIVLAPVHSEFLAQCVTAAKEKRIPLVVIDSGVKADPADYVSYIATDNYKGGVECARRMGKLLNGQGSVLMLKYIQGSASTTEREDGFRDTLTKEFPNIKIAQEKYGGSSRDSALNNAAQLLQAQDKFDGVYACNESTTFGMLKALEEKKLGGQVKFVGFDCAREFIDAIERGVIHAVAVQDPYRMGNEGVKAALKALKGEAVEKRIDTGVTMVDKENLKSDAVQRLVNPKIEAAK